MVKETNFVMALCSCSSEGMKVKQSCIDIATAQAVSHPEFSEVMFHLLKINLGLLATT